MKLEPLLPDEENQQSVLPYWAIISKELRDLGLTKAEYAVFSYIISRAGWNKQLRCVGVCKAGTRRIAFDTRTHPDYVREIVRHLLRVKLITRELRPGQTTYLRPADKLAWLASNPHGVADRAVFQFEETRQEVTVIMMWKRLFALLPGARKIRYERRMKIKPEIFESTLTAVEDAVGRGENAARTGATPIRDPVGLFEYEWRKRIEAKR